MRSFVRPGQLIACFWKVAIGDISVLGGPASAAEAVAAAWITVEEDLYDS